MNLDIDDPNQYLRFFFKDDEKLEDIKILYSSGEMKINEVKEVIIKCLTNFLAQFQKLLSKIIDKDVRKFL